MLYDQHGTPCGLEDTEIIPEFIDVESSTSYFTRISEELPWAITSRDNDNDTHLSFRYGKFERGVLKYEVVEELIDYVEEVLETNVLHTVVDYFRPGDYREYGLTFGELYDCGVLIIHLGETRKMVIRARNSDTETAYNLNSGDVLYISKEENERIEYSIPKEESVKGSFSALYLYMETPYIKRKRHTRYINVLGYGKMPMVYEGDGIHIPEDTIGVLLETGPLNLINVSGFSIN